jgi:hypothetical protein
MPIAKRRENLKNQLTLIISIAEYHLVEMEPVSSAQRWWTVRITVQKAPFSILISTYTPEKQPTVLWTQTPTKYRFDLVVSSNNNSQNNRLK